MRDLRQHQLQGPPPEGHFVCESCGQVFGDRYLEPLNLNIKGLVFLCRMCSRFLQSGRRAYVVESAATARVLDELGYAVCKVRVLPGPQVCDLREVETW